mmetsp:Transcript_14673/g.37231  ORF Transcript_14673/g.37231 Transcript_14673/m.37231 type:complete len:225 (+) Transcript_14673:185-859(+)
MMSSTRRIISAASVALVSTRLFTLVASWMPISFMQPTAPLYTSTPVVVFGSVWLARRLLMISLLSRPALSQMMPGPARSACANAIIASERLPGVLAASSSTTRAICISGQPPPYTTRLSCTVWLSTHSASCSERSASSSTWLDAPRNTMEHASALATPLNLISVSSPIMISSTSLHDPSDTFLGSSKVEAMSPPVTSARRSMPSKSACSIAITPASANSSSGKL